MKILDRYILGTFIKNYLISFFVLVGMYVVLDMVINFDELFEMSQKNAPVINGGLNNSVRILRNLLDFYAYQLPLIFVQLSPIIPVVAAAFTLIRMTRFNELIATLAAGVPLYRTAAPIVFATVSLTVALYPLQELLIPAIIPKLLRDHQDVGRDSRRSFQVKSMEDANGSILMAAKFIPATSYSPAVMQEVDLLERDEQKQPTGHVMAQKATWEAKESHWRLSEDGRHTTGLQPDEKVRVVNSRAEFLPTALTPDEIILYRSRDYVDLLSTNHINQLLASPRNFGVADLLRVKHFRISQYFSDIILALMVIPCVMTREPRSLKAGGVMLLMVTGNYLGLIFLAQHLAGQPAPLARLAGEWPALMAFMPVLLFGPIVVYSLDRLKT